MNAARDVFQFVRNENTKNEQAEIKRKKKKYEKKSEQF